MWTAPFKAWGPDVAAFFTWGPSSLGAWVTFLIMMLVCVYYHVWVIRHEDREYREIAERVRAERRTPPGGTA